MFATPFAAKRASRFRVQRPPASAVFSFARSRCFEVLRIAAPIGFTLTLASPRRSPLGIHLRDQASNLVAHASIELRRIAAPLCDVAATAFPHVARICIVPDTKPLRVAPAASPLVSSELSERSRLATHSANLRRSHSVGSAGTSTNFRFFPRPTRLTCPFASARTSAVKTGLTALRQYAASSGMLGGRFKCSVRIARHCTYQLSPAVNACRCLGGSGGIFLAGAFALVLLVIPLL